MEPQAAPEDPVGAPVPGWRPAARPLRRDLSGRWAALEALAPWEHAAGLFDAFAEDRAGRNWTYLPYGPFPAFESFRDWLEAECTGDDPLFYAVRDLRSGLPLGMASYLRIAPAAGAIEIGHLNFAPALARSRTATEALILMIGHAFDLGYRRVEWKCDALNARSRRAAERLGLAFEGLFRQAAVVKGRNRDTAWYAAIDGDWPRLSAAYEAWLDPANFDGDGRQRRALSTLTAGDARAAAAEA